MLKLKVFTLCHLETGRRFMPPKRPAFKRERVAIARYYWAKRKESRRQASDQHRFAVVHSGTEARIRLKNMRTN